MTHLSAAHRQFAALRAARAGMFSNLKAADDAQFGRLLDVPALTGAQLRVRELRRVAQIALPESEERIVAELEADGSRRWAMLAADILATTTFSMRDSSGGLAERHLSERFELLWDPRAEVRRAAFDGLNSAIAPRVPLLATCLNAMAGFDHTLARRRGVNLIDEAMRRNRISGATVETMQRALREYAPILQSYLKLKARALGLDHLGVQDRSAPLAAPELTVGDVDLARERIVSAFRRYCRALGEWSEQVFERRWIESEMRPSKQPGGFCSTFPLAGETRIFLSFGGSFNSVAGLAHELGHAFNSHCNSALRWWRQLAPASLAETASILCEHFVRDTASQDSGMPARVRRAALASQLDAAVNYLLRIPRDFEFESTFLNERRDGDVSPARLSELMRSAHAAWFGDALQGDGGDALGWAYHHLLFEPTFRLYNFPYSFGYVLSRRIADAFIAEGEGFTPTYVAFLHASGSLPVEEAVASTLSYDVRSEDFWHDGLARVSQQIELFSQLGDID